MPRVKEKPVDKLEPQLVKPRVRIDLRPEGRSVLPIRPFKDSLTGLVGAAYDGEIRHPLTGAVQTTEFVITAAMRDYQIMAPKLLQLCQMYWELEAEIEQLRKK